MHTSFIHLCSSGPFLLGKNSLYSNMFPPCYTVLRHRRLKMRDSGLDLSSAHLTILESWPLSKDVCIHEMGRTHSGLSTQLPGCRHITTVTWKGIWSYLIVIQGPNFVCFPCTTVELRPFHQRKHVRIHQLPKISVSADTVAAGSVSNAVTIGRSNALFQRCKTESNAQSTCAYPRPMLRKTGIA